MKKFIDTDPRLSEFSDREIEDAAAAISTRIAHIHERIASYEEHEELARMFADTIVRLREESESLRGVYTQFVNAGARKIHEKQVDSN